MLAALNLGILFLYISFAVYVACIGFCMSKKSLLVMLHLSILVARSWIRDWSKYFAILKLMGLLLFVLFLFSLVNFYLYFLSKRTHFWLGWYGCLLVELFVLSLIMIIYFEHDMRCYLSEFTNRIKSCCVHRRSKKAQSKDY